MTQPQPSLPHGTTATIMAFYAYWAALPRVDHVPRLSDYLDHAPAALPPFVTIVDVISETQTHVRLMGTGFVELLARDETGKPVPTIYSKAARTRIGQAAWRAVNHPAGYLCTRSIQTKVGRAMEASSVCLPLVNRPEAAPLILTYAALTKDSLGIDHNDQIQNTLDFKLTHWIDIGAGVPE